METGRFTIFTLSSAGETSTISFSPFSFSFSSILASSWIRSTTSSVSRSSSSLMVSYSGSAFSFDKKISTGMNEQYFSSTSLTRYSFANCTLSSFKNKVISVPTVSLLPLCISYSVPPLHVQCTDSAPSL